MESNTFQFGKCWVVLSVIWCAILSHAISYGRQIPGWEGDATDFSSVEAAVEKTIRDGLEGRISSKLVRDALVQLEDLHYHVQDKGLEMSLTNMAVTLSAVQVKQLGTDIVERATSLDLLVPAMEIRGRYKADRLDYADTTNIETGTFRWTLYNTSLSGIAFLGYKNEKMLPQKFIAEILPENSSFQVNRIGPVKNFSEYLLQGTFSKDLGEKLERSLASHLEDALLQRMLRPTTVRLADDEVAKHLRNYHFKSTNNANSFVDNILGSATTFIHDTYHNRIKIPDIREGFTEQVLIVKVWGEFKAIRGSAMGLASVHRVGDTALSFDNSSKSHLHGDIGFKALQLNYQYYKASFMGIGPSGTVKADVTHLAIYLHASVDIIKNKAWLEKFKIQNVGDVNVKITGLGPFNWLASRISSWVVFLFRDQVLNKFEDLFQNYIAEVLDSSDLNDIMDGKVFQHT